MLDTMDGLLRNNAFIGGFDAAWRTYQYEIALEELFHGQPRCPTDRDYSAALGCSSVHWNSSSRARGFIALMPWGEASTEQEPPPLVHWLTNRSLKTMIGRMWTLSDNFAAAEHVLGSELLMVLLKGLGECNLESNVLDLGKLSSTINISPEFLKDTYTFERLVTEVLRHLRHFRKFKAFGRAVDLVRSVHRDPHTLLLAGFRTLAISYFPKIRY